MLKNFVEFFQAIRKIIWEQRIHCSERRQEEINKKLFRLSGDIESTLMAMQYYKNIRKSIDPMEDHWGFAKTRQKELQESEDLKLLFLKRDKQQKFVDRALEKHLKLKAKGEKS